MLGRAWLQVFRDKIPLNVDISLTDLESAIMAPAPTEALKLLHILILKVPDLIGPGHTPSAQLAPPGSPNSPRARFRDRFRVRTGRGRGRPARGITLSRHPLQPVPLPVAGLPLAKNRWQMFPWSGV